MIRKIVKSYIRKIQVFVTWLKYHHRFDLGRNVVIRNLKYIGKDKKKNIIIGEGSVLRNCSFVLNSQNGNIIEIGADCNLINAEFILRNGYGNCIKLGRHCTSGGNVQLAACEGKSIIVGDDCQFAHDIALWTTDHHPIYDLQHKRVNDAKDIRIGNHVWIGTGSLVLKGAEISDGNIIGAHSVVSGKCTEKNSIYVGVPAKPVKHGIVWERRFPGVYEI